MKPKETGASKKVRCEMNFVIRFLLSSNTQLIAVITLGRFLRNVFIEIPFEDGEEARNAVVETNVQNKLKHKQRKVPLSATGGCKIKQASTLTSNFTGPIGPVTSRIYWYY